MHAAVALRLAATSRSGWVAISHAAMTGANSERFPRGLRQRRWLLRDGRKGGGAHGDVPLLKESLMRGPASA